MTDLNERGLLDAWNAEYAADDKKRRRMPRLSRGGRTRTVLVAAGLIGVVGAPAAIGATGDALREGQRNGTATRETQIVARVNEAKGSGTGGYATRQSNLSSSGGGAIYGCRAASTSSESCVRANNLSSGRAFAFAANSGNVVGSITTSRPGDATKPFTTNATGVADGLNADRVDGQDAAAIATAGAQGGTGKFALVTETGEIREQSGGLSVVSRPGINGQPASNPNIYIDTGSSAAGKALDATLAIQNLTDRDGGTAGVQGDFGSGEIAVGRCGGNAVTRVNCVPNGTTDNANVVVVRALEDNSDATSAPKGFYVTIGG